MSKVKIQNSKLREKRGEINANACQYMISDKSTDK
jgi:hypothetical protein